MLAHRTHVRLSDLDKIDYVTKPYRIVSVLPVRSCLAVVDGSGSLHGAADAIHDGVEAAASDTRGHTRRMR